MTGSEFEKEWDMLVLRLSKQFKVTAEYEFILFIMGIHLPGRA